MAEIVTKQNVADAAKELACLFGANKNVYRVKPSIQDGLKPGKRRLFYAWWLREHQPTNTKPETMKKLKSIKCAILAAISVEFHPHGEDANGEALVHEGQTWNNNIMTVVPQGSYGNIRGDKHAARRYIEAKMSEYMIDCFFDDFDKYAVPMKRSYNGEKDEPEYFPAKYPHVFFNPQFSSIGYGSASNIPPFNVQEVLEATIKLIKDPKAKILLIPDSPTGADIIDTGTFKEINKTGNSKFTMRATAEIDYQNNTIHFSSIPLQTSTKDIISKILDFKNQKKMFDEIIEIRDSTRNDEVDLLIILRSDANPDKVLDQLYKKNTGLKAGFPVNISVIDDYEEFDFGVKDALLRWIDNREDDVRSMFNNKYQIVFEKLHMLEVLLMVFNKDNIDTTIKIAKTSKTRKETIEKLMKRYSITSLQAGTIADMRVYNFNQDSYNRYKEEYDKLKKEKKEIKEALNNDDKIKEFIIKQLEEGIKKYGRPRKSKVIKENNDDENKIPNTDHLIGLTKSGYIKKLNIKNYSSIGPIGKENSDLTVVRINNRGDILVVDSTGRVSKISVSAIPDMKFEDLGIEIARYFTVQGDIIGAMRLPSMDILKQKDDDICIIFVTKMGIAKKVPLSEFKKISDYKDGIILNEDDEVVSVLFSFDKSSKDIIISTNLGDGIRLPIKDIKTSKRQSKGVHQITLRENEFVVNACKINPKKKLLFYITSAGRIKLTELKYFPVMSRKDEALPLISLEKNETLVGVAAVDKKDVVKVFRKVGDPVDIYLNEVKVTTRAAKGEKMIKTPKGDSVIAYKIFE